MTMTLDTTQQRFGPQMNFDYSAPSSQQPSFSNPWSSSSPPQPPSSSSLFMGSQQHQQPPTQPQPHHPPAPALSVGMLAGKPPPSQAARPNPTSEGSSSLTPYGALPVPNSTGNRPTLYAVGISSALTQSRFAEIMNLNRMQPASSGPYADASYATSASPAGNQFPTSSAPAYDALGYAPAPVRPATFAVPQEADSARRFSHS